VFANNGGVIKVSLIVNGVLFTKLLYQYVYTGELATKVACPAKPILTGVVTVGGNGVWLETITFVVESFSGNGSPLKIV